MFKKKKDITSAKGRKYQNLNGFVENNKGKGQKEFVKRTRIKTSNIFIRRLREFFFLHYKCFKCIDADARASILFRVHSPVSHIFQKKKNIIIFMDPTNFMNLSRRGAFLWTRFITVLRVPCYVDARDWPGYFFFFD